jgi:hypothetical protein
MKPASTTTLEVINETATATWAEAKKLVSQVRAGARAWLELGQVLEELRAEFFAERAGAGRPSDWAKANVKRIAPHDAAQLSAPSEKGWQAKVREELGISDDTARRYMEKADYVRRMYSLKEGQNVEYRAVKNGDVIIIEATPERIAQAEKALGDLVAGVKAPGAAWAGVLGEGQRVDGYGAGSKKRDTTDYLGIWVKASRALRNIGPLWHKVILPGARQRAVDELSLALAMLPAEVRESVVAAAEAEAARR